MFQTILKRLVNSSQNHDHKKFLDSLKYNDWGIVFAEEPKMISHIEALNKRMNLTLSLIS